MSSSSSQRTDFTLSHEDTPTSKAVRKLEDQLETKLVALVIQIKKDPIKDISLLQRKYGMRVWELIRSYSTQIYQEGVKYVNSVTKTEPLTTTSDLETVRELTQGYYDRFWFRVNKLVTGRNDVLESKNDYAPKSELSDNFIVALLATIIATEVLAFATIIKARLLWSSRAGVPILVWVTARDERVCPICRPLHGKQYALNDPQLEMMPDSTHPRCRCRYIIKEL